MKCADVQEWIAEYWDLADDDFRKHKVQQHLQGCRACFEQFRLWEESAELIQTVTASIIPTTSSLERSGGTSTKVMNRIYADESWRMPVAARGLGLSLKLRRTIIGFMTFFLALFAVSFLFALNDRYDEKSTYSSIVPIASLDGGYEDGDGVASISVLEGVPVASISDPLVMRFTPIESDPNYWMTVSLLGLVAVVSIMNWLSRVRV